MPVGDAWDYFCRCATRCLGVGCGAPLSSSRCSRGVLYMSVVLVLSRTKGEGASRDTSSGANFVSGDAKYWGSFVFFSFSLPLCPSLSLSLSVARSPQTVEEFRRMVPVFVEDILLTTIAASIYKCVHDGAYQRTPSVSLPRWPRHTYVTSNVSRGRPAFSRSPSVPPHPRPSCLLRLYCRPPVPTATCSRGRRNPLALSRDPPAPLPRSLPRSVA